MEKIAVDVAVGVFSGLVTSLIESYSETLSREAGVPFADYQASRSLPQKLSDKISGTCRKLPRQDCESIAQFLGNQMTVSGLTQLIKDGAFESEAIKDVLLADAVAQEFSDSALLALSAALQDTFDECIAEEEFAAHYAMLRQIRQLRNQTSEVRATTSRIESTLQDGVVPQIETMAKQMDVLTKHILSPGVAQPNPPSPVDIFVHTPSRQLTYEALTERLEAQYNARFEAANEALNAGQISEALQQFHVLYQEVEVLEDAPSRKVRLRAANGIALCHWYATENADATTWFQTTVSIGGDDKLVRRNKMLIRFLEGDKAGTRVLAEALLLDHPHNFDGASVLANLAMLDGQPEIALQHFEKNSDGSLNYLLALAGQNLRLERFHEAQKNAEAALQTTPGSRDAKIALADAKALPVVIRRNEIQSDRSLSAAEKQVLEEVIPIYAEALSDRNRPQSQEAWQRLVVNYSSFTSILNRLDEADVVLRTFLQSHPTSVDALRNAFIVSVKAKRLDRAIEQAELLLKLDPSFENAARLLETLGQAERNAQALETYLRLLPNLPELEISGRILSVIGRCLYHTGEIEKGFATLDQACNSVPLWPPALLTRAYCLEKEGRDQEAEVDLQRSCRETQASWHWLSNYEYGMFLARRARWSEALDRFKTCGGSESDSSILPEYLVALSQLGQWKECIDALEQRPKPRVFHEVLTDLEANCRLHVYDFKGAEACLRELTDRQGTNPYHWSNLAHVLYREDKIDAAISTLRRAIQIHATSPELWINLSRMCLIRGQKKEAVQAATQAATLAPNSDAVHKWIFAIGQLAIRGEELPESFLPLLQKTVAFLLKSPESGLTQVSIGKQLKEVKKALRRMRRSVQRTAKIYNSSPAPLHILRSPLARTLFELWLLAVGGTADLKIRMSRGHQEDQVAEMDVIKAEATVVVEFTALLTLSLCQQLDILPKLFKKVLVPTTVFEEAKQAAEALVFETNTSGVLTMERGRPVYVEQNPALRENQLALLNRIIDFCKSSSVELVPLPPQALGDAMFEHRTEVLGLQGAHAGLVAAQHQAILYSDDWLYRSLFLNEHQVAGTCSQAILRLGGLKNHLNQQEYQRAVLLLISSHYTFVADEVGTYMALIENGYGPDHELSRQILRRFSSGEVTRVPAAAFLGQFLGNVRRVASTADRAAWMKAIVEAFMEARPTLSDAGQFCLGMMLALPNVPELFFDILVTLARDSSIDPSLAITLDGCAKGFIKEMSLLARGVPGFQISPQDWRTRWNQYRKILRWVPMSSP